MTVARPTDAEYRRFQKVMQDALSELERHGMNRNTTIMLLINMGLSSYAGANGPEALQELLDGLVPMIKEQIDQRGEP